VQPRAGIHVALERLSKFRLQSYLPLDYAMTHATLYTLANSLGILAMLTVVGYHIVAVNARHIAKNGEGK
ncbi:hypothetical protein GGU10DRAFT_180653, partial [Lentinula aff. detonsa]